MPKHRGQYRVYDIFLMPLSGFCGTDSELAALPDSNTVIYLYLCALFYRNLENLRVCLWRAMKTLGTVHTD